MAKNGGSTIKIHSGTRLEYSRSKPAGYGVGESSLYFVEEADDLTLHGPTGKLRFGAKLRDPDAAVNRQANIFGAFLASRHGLDWSE